MEFPWNIIYSKIHVDFLIFFSLLSISIYSWKIKSLFSFPQVKSEMGQENTAFSNLDERRSQDSENKSNKSNKVELYKIKSWRQDES